MLLNIRQRLSDGVLPATVDNIYRGHRLALWAFALLALVTIARSLVHILKTDGGAQTIATIPLDSFPPAAAQTVVALFALWGISQLLLGLVYALVLCCYRSLIPCMLLLIFCEYVLRLFALHYKIIETTGTAPGAVANLVLPPLVLVLFLLSLPRAALRDQR